MAELSEKDIKEIIKDTRSKKSKNRAGEVIREKLKELTIKVAELTASRVKQQNIMPDSVKQRHVGESVRFIRSGLEADLPTEGEEPAQGSAFYFCTDSGKLKIWDGSSWLSTTLS